MVGTYGYGEMFIQTDISYYLFIFILTEINAFAWQQRCVVLAFFMHANRAQLPVRRKGNTFKSHWDLKVKATKMSTRENGSDQVVTGFIFSSDWLRWWHEFFGPIFWTERSKPK